MFWPIAITLLTGAALALSRSKCTLDAEGRAYTDALVKADIAELRRRQGKEPTDNASIAASLHELAKRAEARGCMDEARQLHTKADQVAKGNVA